MVIKLKAAGRNIAYYKEENDKYKIDNEKLVAKHLIGVEELTPRPRFREIVEERKLKLDFTEDFDKFSTEYKVSWLADKFSEQLKQKTTTRRKIPGTIENLNLTLNRLELKSQFSLKMPQDSSRDLDQLKVSKASRDQVTRQASIEVEADQLLDSMRKDKKAFKTVASTFQN